MSLSLRVKSSITAISVIALSFMVLTTKFGQANRKAELEKENQHLHQTVDAQIGYLKHDLNQIDRDISFLISSPYLPAIILANQNNIKSEYNNKLNHLRNEYRRYLSSKSRYSKLDIYRKQDGWNKIISLSKVGGVDDDSSDVTTSINGIDRYPYSDEIEIHLSAHAHIDDIIKWDFSNYKKENIVLLNISRPVYNKQDDLLGVVVIHVNFSNQIGRIMDELRVGDHLLIGISGSGYLLHLFGSNDGKNGQVIKHYHLVGVKYNTTPDPMFVKNDIVEDDKGKQVNDFLFHDMALKLDSGNTLSIYMGKYKEGLQHPYFLVLHGSWYDYLAIFLLVSWLGVILSWLPLKQLNKVSDVVKRIAKGEATNKDLPITLNNEVGDLSRAFNRLLDNLDQKEKEIEYGKERLELALKGASKGIWDWNIVTNELYLSPRWKEMLGYADGEIENSIAAMNKLFHPDDKLKKWNNINAYLSGSSDRYETEFRMRHKDGHYVDILSRAFVVRDKDNKPVRLVGMHTDITSRKQQEEKRIQFEKKQKEALVKEVHHRIKNNLQGVASLLRQHTTNDPDTNDQLASAISQVYTVAKVHGLQGATINEAISMPNMVKEIANMINNYSGTEIKFHGCSGCDDFMLHEHEAVPIALIINELIMNSCKHSHNENVPTVTMVCSENDEISIILTIQNEINNSQESIEAKNDKKGNGLDLARSLLPLEGAKLDVGAEEGMYVARMEFTNPIIYKAKGSDVSEKDVSSN